MHPPCPALDVNRKFVRLTGSAVGPWVDFEFAIGEPGLFVEMRLPREGFAAFCQLHQVEMLEAPPDTGARPGDWDWRVLDAGRQRFRQP